MSIIQSSSGIDSQHPSYVAIADDRDLIASLLGGSKGMRSTGVKYLPKYNGETTEEWANRSSKTYLNPTFATAIENHAAKPFSKEIVVENHSEDPRVARLVENADGMGNSITEYTKRKFSDADSYGMSFTLVDYAGEVARSKADDMKNSVVFRHLKCLDVFNWDTELIGGQTVLKELRFKVETHEVDGFDRKQKSQIHRWFRDSWEIWEKEPESSARTQTERAKDKLNPDLSNNYKKIRSGVNSLGMIPLVPLYFKRKGFMEAESPQQELAEVMLEHYQLMSDQNQLESMARVAMLFAKGMYKEETDKIVIGPKRLIATERHEATLEVIEHGGTAVGIGRAGLKVLEDKAEELSLKPEINRSSGDVTASEVLSNSFNSMAELLTWTKATENSITDCFKLAYQWIAADVPDELRVHVYDDFSIIGNTSDVGPLLEYWREGGITSKRLMIEYKRRGLLDIATDIDSEVSEAHKEWAERQAIINPPMEKADESTSNKPNAADDKL